MSPKSASRALSPARTATNGGDRPFSPRTAASQAQSLKSRNTQKTNRTAYPPLPESVLEDNFSRMQSQRAPSPVDRQTNKSPSIAPSDSPSQARSKRSNKPPVNEASLRPVKSVRSTTEANGGASRYAMSQRDGQSKWCTLENESDFPSLSYQVAPKLQCLPGLRPAKYRCRLPEVLITSCSVPQLPWPPPRGRGVPITTHRPRPLRPDPHLLWTTSMRMNGVW